MRACQHHESRSMSMEPKTRATFALSDTRVNVIFCLYIISLAAAIQGSLKSRKSACLTYSPSPFVNFVKLVTSSAIVLSQGHLTDSSTACVCAQERRVSA